LDYVNMGRSGLKVSRACLGTMNFGTTSGLAACEESEARKIIDAFLPQGPGPNDRGLSRLHLTRALDASLRRLGTDYIDLYYCHQWDAGTPVAETMAALDGFVRAGKVRYVGCSNFTAAQIVESQWAADRAGGTPFVCLQPQYSLVTRSIEAEILPVCERHGLGTAVYSPLAGGVLSGRYRPGSDPGPGTRMGKLMAMPQPAARQWVSSLLTGRNLAIAEEVTGVAAQLSASATEVALAWTAAQPTVSSVIIGPRSEDQLQQNLAGFSLDLPARALAHLTKIPDPAERPVTGSVL
jgi:aryl-alcohol dehydrogenase-like predicted oxidoreductase